MNLTRHVLNQKFQSWKRFTATDGGLHDPNKQTFGDPDSESDRQSVINAH